MFDINDIKSRLERIEKLLVENGLKDKEILNFEEASRYLGLSKSYLYKLTSSKKVPHYSPNNKKLYFKKEELDQWLLRNKKDVVEDIDKQASNYLINNLKKF